MPPRTFACPCGEKMSAEPGARGVCPRCRRPYHVSPPSGRSLAATALAVQACCPRCGTLARLAPAELGRERCPDCALPFVPKPEDDAPTVAFATATQAPSPAATSSGRLAAATREPPEVEAARADPRKVLGHFVLLSELGKGGMGVVWRAWNSKLRRVVALKTLIAGDAAGDTEIKRFYREAEAVARLRHPGVVAVHEVGEQEGKHYLAMDFIDGRTFEKRLDPKSGEKLPVAKAIEVVRDVARAVHYAHEQGVIHRDLKPQNIMIDGSGRAFVLDFGLARITTSQTKLTKTGTGLGTPAYMSPEHVGNGHPVDARSDVYSLGCVLYHVLAGRAPFAGTSPYKMMLAHAAENPVPPTTVNRRVAPDAETICLKCLEKSPERRYATAADLADDLDRLIAGEPIVARPLGGVERALRSARRNRVPILAAAGGVLVLVLAGAVFLKGQSALSEAERLRAEQARASEEAARSPMPVAGATTPPVTASPAPSAAPLAPLAFLELDPPSGKAVLLATPALRVTGRLSDPKAGPVKLSGKEAVEAALDEEGRFTALVPLDAASRAVVVRAGEAPREVQATIPVELDLVAPEVALEVPARWRGGPVELACAMKKGRAKLARFTLELPEGRAAPAVERPIEAGRASARLDPPEGARSLRARVEVEDELARRAADERPLELSVGRAPAARIDEPRDGAVTGKAALRVAGRVEGEDLPGSALVVLLQDGVEAARVEVVLKPGGAFDGVLAIPEKDGAYSVEVRAADRTGNEGKARVAVRVDRALPELHVEAPSKPLSALAEAAAVSVRSSKPLVSLKVGDKELVPSRAKPEPGPWKLTVALKPGERRELEVQAEDEAGHVVRAEKVKLEREKAGSKRLPVRPGSRVKLPDGTTITVFLFRLPDGSDLEMVHVPEGEFVMGSDNGEDPESHPKHSHAMPKPYWIGRKNVTVAQYHSFVKEGHPRPPAPPFETKDDQPVVNVAWTDARAFCAWAGLRLPTEAEWEKAARGTDGRTFPWGNDDAASDRCIFNKHPVYGGRSCAPAGSCPLGASPYGALDMAGNASQWIDDWYEENVFARYAKGDLAPPAGGSQRVIRGGNFKDDGRNTRSVRRQHWEPAGRTDYVGFRVALSPEGR